MYILSHMSMYPRLWVLGAVLLLMLVLLVNLRVPLRVIAAGLVLLPASPLLVLRGLSLLTASVCDWLVAGRPWSRPLVWAARTIESHTQQEETR